MNIRDVTQSENENFILNRLAAGSAGFFLQFDLVPTAWHIPITRITLILMIPFILYLFHYITTYRKLTKVTGYLVAIPAFSLLHIASTGMSLSFGASNTDLALALGFVLYLVGGIGIYITLFRRGGTDGFCWGLLLGALCSLPILVLQANGFGDLLIKVGFAEPRQVVQQVNLPGLTERLTGMWGHANEVGHVLAIATPAACYLYLYRQTRLPLAIAAIVSVVGYYYTVNRGGIIASMLVFIMTLFIKNKQVGIDYSKQKPNDILIAAIALGVIVIALYLLPTPEFLYKRLDDANAINQNAGGRFATTLAGLQAALQSPFGSLSSDWRWTMKGLTGFTTTHNGFLSLAFELGALALPFFIFAFGAVVVQGFRTSKRLSLDTYLMLASIQVSISFMFEELSDCDAFMLMMGIIMARVYSGVVDVKADQSDGGKARRRRRRTSQETTVPSPALADVG